MSTSERRQRERAVYEVRAAESNFDVKIRTPRARFNLSVDVDQEPARVVYPPIPDKHARAAAIADFTLNARHLLESGVRLEGTRSGDIGIDTTETATAILDELAGDKQWERYLSSIRGMINADIDYTRAYLAFRETGMTIKRGEAHMGETPQPVAEQQAGPLLVLKAAYGIIEPQK